MGLIKAPNVPLSASPFSMTDIEDAARRVLLRARRQADQLLAAAQVEAEALKTEAVGKGMAEGLAQGMAQGREEGRKAAEAQTLVEQKAQLQLAVAALTDAANVIHASRCELESAGLQEVVKLAIAIARRVTKRQAEIDPSILAANLEEAMKLVVTHAGIRIEIHPTQRGVLDAALPALGLRWPSLRHAEVVECVEVSPGGCRVVTCRGKIDADLETQLDRVVADLLPAGGEPAQ